MTSKYLMVLVTWSFACNWKVRVTFGSYAGSGAIRVNMEIIITEKIVVKK